MVYFILRPEICQDPGVLGFAAILHNQPKFSNSYVALELCSIRDKSLYVDSQRILNITNVF